MKVTLRELRERNLITKAALAKLWGVSENIITRSENKTRNIDIDLLFMYTSTFDVNIGGDLLISSKEDIKNKLKKECPILKRAKQVGEEYKKQEEERLRKIKQSKSV